MNLTSSITSRKYRFGNVWCLHDHLKVSSQDLLMGQQVKLPSLTPSRRHGIENRGNDWSSEGFEYPSGQKIQKNLHQKAEYMTENRFRIKKNLRSLSGPYMTLGGCRRGRP